MPASERYRTHDGTCNNKRRPRWGASQMPFNRFLPPEYGDGVDSVRSSTDGSTLSSSRFVSLLVHGARDGEAPLTLMIAQWGQLLDHDMTSTAQPRSINGSIPSCCGGKDFHPSCFPIKVPLDDPWLSPLKVRCLEFLRSAPAQRRDCVLSWREQTNQATSYIDASPIYSNSAKSSDNARIFRNGQLIYGRGNAADDVCQRGAIATQCIRAGDGRSGEQPGLLAMHHVWVGEHNRIALELSELNPHWSDEKIFQETRRIVGAMFQHITYREFLPIVLGKEVCKLFDLELLSTGYYEGYDSKTNPTVANAFSSAAFRFGHSLVQNSYMRCDRHHNVINNNVSLHKEFQNGDIGTAGSLHRLLRGLASQRALKRDEFITPELTNHLFQTPGFPFGLDLAAINIQRGRDHGLAPYTSWRVPCGLSPIQSWDEFANVVGPESAKRIGHAYRSVHDIDLFVGGIAERPVVGGLVGPTFACIIAQQFSNSRRGDRFWYENGDFESSFTPAQLHSLRRVSLAQVLCRAVGGGTFQPHIFIPAEMTDNERQTCGSGILGSIDLTPWLEKDPFLVSKQQPDHIFNILQSDSGQNQMSATSFVKEDKAGFSNRIKPGNPHVDFNPNSATGFLRPTNGSIHKINDKLDLKRKTLTTTKTHNNRHVTPTRKTSVNGISNKLDKSPKLGTRVKNVITRKPGGLTPKRTVIINNVPLELRSAAEGISTTTETDDDTHSKTATDTDLPESRADDEGLLTMDRPETTTVRIDRRHLNDTGQTADELVNTKRVQRRVNIHELLKTKTTDTPAVSKLLHAHRNRTTTTAQTASATTGSFVRVSRTTKSSKLSRTTKRGIELRSHYQSRPVYPQKVVVNGPNTNDQYEIEINIRQTNKSPVTRPIGNEYADYTTSTIYRPNYSNYENSYAPHYLDYGSTTPGYDYLQTHRDTILHSQRTKPPTIIYLNDNDDKRLTTRAPNIFQNFLTFATNPFNRRPTESPSPISVTHKERPYQETHVINNPISSTHSFTANSAYAPRPTASPLSQSYPISSSSQIGPNSHTNFLHASSSAVSSGQFGSISGSAVANGADSTFSFNIRPRPELNPVFSSYPHPQSSNGGYGFSSQSPYKPDYSHSQSELYYDRELVQQNSSPFSSGRPKTQTYYGLTSELKEAGGVINEIAKADHKLDIVRDFDYLSRTLGNVTTDESTQDTTDDYVYDEDEPNKTIDFIKLEKKTANLITSSSRISDKDNINSTTNHTTAESLDDNFVLPILLGDNETQTTYMTEMPRPIMSTTRTNSKVTDFPDSVGKQLGSNILAETEDYDERAAQAHHGQKQFPNVAFAPINVLTKPDRPDNWVIFNRTNEEPLLPPPPALSSATGAEPTKEVPMPFSMMRNKEKEVDLNTKETE
ncbi:GH18450 [Drosophila grimshawi]|uniref:GH18450 n=2 Tax=Drosophila grimshawi TaxID=7222 RepID=B4JIN3_DROGR|nr:GH18450 [Drosophila grimshawi]